MSGIPRRKADKGVRTLFRISGFRKSVLTLRFPHVFSLLMYMRLGRHSRESGNDGRIIGKIAHRMRSSLIFLKSSSEKRGETSGSDPFVDKVEFGQLNVPINTQR